MFIVHYRIKSPCGNEARIIQMRHLIKTFKKCALSYVRNIQHPIQNTGLNIRQFLNSFTMGKGALPSQSAPFHPVTQLLWVWWEGIGCKTPNVLLWGSSEIFCMKYLQMICTRGKANGRCSQKLKASLSCAKDLCFSWDSALADSWQTPIKKV